MATRITNYQCPACTGPLHFESSTGMLQCDYCGSVFTTAQIEAMYAEQNAAAEAAVQAEAAQAVAQAAEQAESGDGEWDVAGAGGSWGEDAASLRAYNCPSCGAELICEETTAATSCPYCGNPTVIPSQLGGILKPDYVIPFKLDKKAAVAALKKHYGRKIFLPRAFSAENHIQEVKGIYVPFWLFSTVADGTARFQCTRSHTHTEGDYRVTTTEHFNVVRAGSAPFDRIPVDGSSKMPDAHMDSIEPFDYSELTDFSLSYLPGYLADKYDVSAGECAERANARCRRSLEDMLRSDVRGYETVVPMGSDIRLRRGSVKYALLPVWLLSTKWHNKDYLFAMNGQTGKLIGDLPVSKGRYLAVFFGIFAALMLLLNLSGAGMFFADMIGSFFG